MWFKQYATLDDTHREDPIGELQHLCNATDVFYLRQEIHSMLKGPMGSESWQGDNPSEKNTHCWHAELTIHFVELGYLIANHAKKEKIVYSQTFKPDV